MLSQIKLYASIAVVAVVGALFAMLRIQSSRLESAKKALGREKMQREAAQEATRAIQESNKVKANAEAIRERNRASSDNRDRLRKYTRD